MPGRMIAWAGGVVAGIALTGLAAYLVAMGLDKADKLASVLAMFVSVAGLAVAVAGILGERRRRSGAQGVYGSSAGGSVTQIRDVKGDVRISRRDTGPRPVPASTSAPVPDARPELEGSGQSVRDSYVAGDVDQVDGAGGDVTVEEST